MRGVLAALPGAGRAGEPRPRGLDGAPRVTALRGPYTSVTGGQRGNRCGKSLNACCAQNSGNLYFSCKKHQVIGAFNFES